MKIHKIIIITTLVLSFYVWLYDGYLYQQTYVKYLPNYEKEVSFPTYPAETDQITERNPLLESTPMHGKLMYWSIREIIILTLMMLIVSVISLAIFLFRNFRKMTFNWILTNSIVYLLIFYFVFNTNFFD